MFLPPNSGIRKQCTAKIKQDDLYMLAKTAKQKKVNNKNESNKQNIANIVQSSINIYHFTINFEETFNLIVSMSINVKMFHIFKFEH